LQQDNKTPALNATVYSAPISLSALFPPPNIPPAEVNPLLHMAGTVTLNAVAIDDAANVGPVPVLPVVYQVDLAPPVVTASLPSGNYPAPQTLTLTCDDGVGSGCAVMYFTTDNTSAKLSDSCNPTASAQRYTQPLVLTGGATLNVLAVDKAGNCSTKLVGIYALDNPAAETKSGGGAVDSFWLLTLLAGCAGRPLKKSLSRLSFANGSPRCRLRGTLRAPARLRFTSLRKVY
jgi:hypothetical protein